MIKHKFFNKFLKEINISVNNLIKNYLNKLNFKNLSIITRSNKFFITIVALIILCLSYLLIPNIYGKTEIREELKSQLSDKFNLNFNFSENLRYNFFPRPHFTNENSTISKDQNEVSKIKKLKIFVSLNNLFSLKDIKINDLILENANFDLDKQNHDFFAKLLKKNFKNSKLIIKDSNIFYRNIEKEVLFINKISKMKYYYDTKNLKNIVIAKNEIFNLPYILELHDNKIDKKIFSKLNIKIFKLNIENYFDYSGNIIKGSSNLTKDNNKSNAIYNLKNDSINFTIFDKLSNANFSLKGEIDFNPFYSILTGKFKKIDLSSFLNSNSLIVQLLKTEVLNNDNLNFNLDIKGNKILHYQNFVNISLISKIKEGFIDLDNTEFSWKDYTIFKISNSLIYTKDNELILDGKLDIIIKNYREVYKLLLTPKKYRNEIKKIELNFNYNFDQKILGFENIKIDNQINENINNYLKSLKFRNDKLQNNIYLKNTMNKAIISYAG